LSARSAIKIANPPAGHAGYVGPAHAERWIRQGKAVRQLNGQIRLSDNLKRLLARLGPVIPGAEYDAIGRTMTTSEKRHIPLAQPPQRMTRK